MTRYRTIVADPPWDHSDGTGLSMMGGGGLVLGEQWSGRTPWCVFLGDEPVAEFYREADAVQYIGWRKWAEAIKEGVKE